MENIAKVLRDMYLYERSNQVVAVDLVPVEDSRVPGGGVKPDRREHGGQAYLSCELAA
jgi:hypothetical protein